VAQSSHNWLLDTAANTGLVGLSALLLLLGAAAVRSLRAENRGGSEGVPYIWMAMAAYCALTLLNPLSLAAHTTFFVLLGMLIGRADRGYPEPAPMSIRLPARLAVAAPGALVLATLAILLPVADLRAEGGWQAYARGDFAAAAARYGRAAELLPIVRDYRVREARAYLSAGAMGDREALVEAERRLMQFDREFGLDSGTAVALATARIGLGAPREDVYFAADLALASNPHGVLMESYVEVLRSAATSPAVLTYIERDRWVLVELVE
jgi:hypothetical protein